MRKRNYMGQKVNPVGLRVGINRGWDSIWFAKKNKYGKFLIEDYKIRDYIKKNVINSGVSQVIIERSSKKCIVTIYTSRPGFVIGKKGSDVEKIKKNISKITSSEISLNIKEIKKPELNAYLVAENIAQQLVKRIAYRKTMKRAIQSAIANAENNNQYDIDNLYIKEAYVGKSIVLKRFRARAKGRASAIKKPYANLTIILSENINKKKELHWTKS